MNEKHAAVPKLRFPEFFANGGVVFEKGNDLFEAISNKEHNADLPVLSITQEQGAIPREFIDYKVFVSDKSLESYKVVEIGDFIISLRSFQGGIEYSQYHGICSPAYIVLRKKSLLFDQYYKHYFKTAQFIRDLNKKLEGIRDGKLVSYHQFSDIDIPKPEYEEQKKVAECLSSLDDLINAESKKLTALKDHKSGIVQILFPAKGNSTPEWRFPEFRKTGAWKTTCLCNLAKRIAVRNKEGEKLPVLTNSAVDGVVDQNEYFDRKIVNQNHLDNYYVIEVNDYVYNPRISISAPVGPISKNKIYRGVMSPLYTIFRFEEVNTGFYEQYFRTSLWHEYIRQHSNTGARHDRINISTEDFMKLPVPVCPNPDEQERIADCLSQIDSLITVQAKKVEYLRLHKVGLVQSLFPSV